MPFFDSTNTDLDLYSQCEELKGLLRGNSLLLKDQESKHAKAVESYETRLDKSNEENRQLKEKYEKICEAQRKLEKLNSNLEDKLLKIVGRYESEQKNLLEDLTLAHAKLVECKVTISELEKQKDSYRQDCNLAVSLLQCKSNEFHSHQYNTLPINIKDRIRSCLSEGEIANLENSSEAVLAERASRESSATAFKLPIFQPTAAAAMMQMHSTQLQRSEMKSEAAAVAAASDNSSIYQVGSQRHTSITLNAGGGGGNDAVNFDNGTVSVKLLAQVLKKDADHTDNAKKSLRFFPYVCLRCKKELVVRDSSVQTDPKDVASSDQHLRVLYGNSKNFHILTLNEQLMTRSKTVGNKLSDMAGNESSFTSGFGSQLTIRNSSHQKCASADYGTRVESMSINFDENSKSSGNSPPSNKPNSQSKLDARIDRSIQHI